VCKKIDVYPGGYCGYISIMHEINKMHNTIFKTMFPKLIQDLPGDKIKYSDNDINTFYDNVKKLF
jgi:hypothetical protein